MLELPYYLLKWRSRDKWAAANCDIDRDPMSNSASTPFPISIGSLLPSTFEEEQHARDSIDATDDVEVQGLEE
jgi:hypothetical protein